MVTVTHADNLGDGITMIELAITDPDVRAEIERFVDPRLRDDYLQRALKVGVLAMRTASGTIDADIVQRQVERVIAQVTGKLSSWQETTETAVSTTLASYFDPGTGVVMSRFHQLVATDGDLERAVHSVMKDAHHSLGVLLERYLGEQSTFMTTLDPTESNRFVQHVRTAMSDILAEQQKALLDSFTDPERPTSIVSRVQQLIGRQDDALAKRLEQEDKVRRELLELLRKDVQDTVRLILDKISEDKGDRKSRAMTTLGGFDFEEAVYHRARVLAEHDCTVTRTGNGVGKIPNSKVGDVVVELGPETSTPGVKIVIEAKRDGSYDESKTKHEANVARRNRDAQVCLFVHSVESARDWCPPFKRVGDVVIVLWDASDKETDIWFEAGLTVCRALVVQNTKTKIATGPEFKVFDRAVETIEKQADAIAVLRASCASVIKSVTTIEDKARVIEGHLVREIVLLRNEVDTFREYMALPTMAALPGQS